MKILVGILIALFSLAVPWLLLWPTTFLERCVTLAFSLAILGAEIWYANHIVKLSTSATTLKEIDRLIEQMKSLAIPIRTPGGGATN